MTKRDEKLTAHVSIVLTKSYFFENYALTTMENLRTHGDAPYTVAVLHGGPGAPGSAGALARELSHICGVLEPLQTADSVQGQIEELKEVLDSEGATPIILIGHSWGAWLALLFTTQYPQLVKKLILIGSGAFEEKYVVDLMKRRLMRLGSKEQAQVQKLLGLLDNTVTPNKDAHLAALGRILGKADSFELLPENNNEAPIKVQGDIYQKVWNEARQLRESGKLLTVAQTLRCPVLAIHGDYDPTPPEGVQLPLSQSIKDFRFVLLNRCGHEPWRERYAQKEFFEVLKAELATTVPD